MLNEDYKEMLQLLSEEQVDFIIVGAYALGAHGYPRATGDIDIWVKPNNTNSRKLYKALSRFGAPLEQIEIDDFSMEGIIVQIGVIPRRIDIITKIDGVTYEEADEDKITVEVEGLMLPVISLDKLIKNKFAIWKVEAPGQQGAKTLEYLDIPSFCTGNWTGCIGVQNVTLFLSEPLGCPLKSEVRN